MRRTWMIALVGAAAASAASAQQGALEPRVDRLEREMRAVQRSVFPGGAGRTVAPDIAPPSAVPAAPGIPATSVLADLDARLATLERQQAVLTGQIEQNGYRLRQLEEAFAAYRRATDARLGNGDPAPPPRDEAVPAPAPAPVPAPRATAPAAAASTPAQTPAARPIPSGRPDPARAERVAAVARPVPSGDAGEDAYLYGYRLWDAKLYPEAQAQLKDTVARYPRHRRASFAQNLLGRAYLDAGQPSLASMALYDSFKKYPDGERAADSLYFLGQALMKLNKPADACKVYAELDASYGAKMSPELKARAAQGRVDARCQVTR